MRTDGRHPALGLSLSFTVPIDIELAPTRVKIETLAHTSDVLVLHPSED